MAPRQRGEGLSKGCVPYGSCQMHHPGCWTHGATWKIGWRFPATAGGQQGDPGMHQEGFPLVPRHPLGSSPTHWVVFEGAGSSIAPTDTFSQLPALRGDFQQCQTRRAQSGIQSSLSPGTPGQAASPRHRLLCKAKEDRMRFECKHARDKKTNGSGGNTMTSPAVSGNICQMAEVISCFAAHLLGTSHRW